MEKEKRICLRNRDFNFIMYLAEYGIITNENVKLFYDSKYYYKNRLASLAKGEFVERLYGKVVLGRKGKSYLNKIGLGYRNINRNETYKKRMERISDVSCKVQLSEWYFEPSWRCSVNTYTKRGNRFIGVMSREKRWWQEDDEDFYKRSYIVYFLHKDITPRELKYIDKELDRNKNDFRGAIIFIEDEWLLNHPKFSNINFSENYIIIYQKEIWEIFKKILDEDYMKNKIINIFGEDVYRVKGYIYEMYCKKEDDLYTYIFPMPFVDISIMDWINEMVDSSLFSNTRFKVVCNDFGLRQVRKFLKDDVDVICIT
mgnify:FL=1